MKDDRKDLGFEKLSKYLRKKALKRTSEGKSSFLVENEKDVAQGTFGRRYD